MVEQAMETNNGDQLFAIECLQWQSFDIVSHSLLVVWCRTSKSWKLVVKHTPIMESVAVRNEPAFHVSESHVSTDYGLGSYLRLTCTCRGSSSS